MSLVAVDGVSGEFLGLWLGWKKGKGLAKKKKKNSRLLYFL